MIGMKIYIAEFASIKQPAIRKIMLQISKKVNWLPATLANSSEAAVEIPKRVQTKENSDAHATISIMPPVVFAESIRISHRSLNFTSL